MRDLTGSDPCCRKGTAVKFSSCFVGYVYVRCLDIGWSITHSYATLIIVINSRYGILKQRWRNYKRLRLGPVTLFGGREGGEDNDGYCEFYSFCLFGLLMEKQQQTIMKLSDSHL